MRKRMATNWALLLSFILSASSGIRLHFLGHGMGHGACHLWRTFHLWASIMLLIMMIIHIKMHWNWYRNWFRKRIGKQKQDNSPPFNHLSTACPDRHHPFGRRMQKKHHWNMALPFGMADDSPGRGTCFQTPVIVMTIRRKTSTDRISRSSFAHSKLFHKFAPHQ